MANMFYLIVSLILIGWFAGLQSLLGIVLATLFSYYVARFVTESKTVYYSSIALIVLILVLIRIQVPGYQWLSIIGISYFGLQMISYLVDVKNERIACSGSFVEYGLYICYYPHLLVGPIESFDDFQRQIKEKSVSFEKAYDGLLRVLFGLFKKLVIASKVAIIIDEVAATSSGLVSLAMLLLYSLELYCDFSGAMDIVLGVSSVLGFSLMENFNHPFSSETIAEFWRRWHISLGAFLRKYIYIPLGGNRKGKLRQYINILVVFIASGFWHGSSYLLWGLLNGIFVCTKDLLKTKSKWFNRGLTFLLISLSWAFFICPDSISAIKMIASISSLQFYIPVVENIGTVEFIVLVIYSIAMVVVEIKKEAIKDYLNQHITIQTLAICGLTIVVLLFGSYGIGFIAESFIYSKF